MPVFFTPLEETFEHILKGSGIAFNGTKDNWADCKRVAELCREYDIPLMTIDNANHSLETGAVTVDIANLDRVIKTVEDYLITV